MQSRKFNVWRCVAFEIERKITYPRASAENFPGEGGNEKDRKLAKNSTIGVFREEGGNGKKTEKIIKKAEK